MAVVKYPTLEWFGSRFDSERVHQLEEQLMPDNKHKTDAIPCLTCGRTKKAHETPPFEYAAMFGEQMRCITGYKPRWPNQ